MVNKTRITKLIVNCPIFFIEFIFVSSICSGTVQGVIDLFRLPYEQYQRDGRIVRGIQLGAQSFTSRTALAALELTTRLIYLLQVIHVGQSNNLFFLHSEFRYLHWLLCFLL